MRRELTAGVVAVLIVIVPSHGTSGAQRSERTQSTATTTTQSHSPSMSPDGRFVAFVSTETRLVAGDTNGVSDVFLRDTQQRRTTRVSVSSSGAQANRDSVKASVSWDGRYVAFESAASNLVSGDSNAARDVFVRDLLLGKTTRVSASASGSQGNRGSFAPAISGDGAFVAFESDATNLVSCDSNNTRDVFRVQWAQMTVVRASVSPDGRQATEPCTTARVSAHGDVVMFVSKDLTLDPVRTAVPEPDSIGLGLYVTDIGLNTIARDTNMDRSWDPGGATLTGVPDLSGDGSRVVYSYVVTISSDRGYVVSWAWRSDTRIEMHRRAEVGVGPASTNVDGSLAAILDYEDLTADDHIILRRLGEPTTDPAHVLFPVLHGATCAPAARSPLLDCSMPLSASGQRFAFASVAAYAPGDTDGTLDVWIWDSLMAEFVHVSRPSGG